MRTCQQGDWYVYVKVPCTLDLRSWELYAKSFSLSSKSRQKIN
jgi:hypothetical protein